tara:strand:- start:2239 stop:4155 length:1917 start_codon:yes stop_codon:yes gene_type:complete
MCGIVGVWGGIPDKMAVLARSRAAMRHRGPDDEGFWEDTENDLGLAHVRLSVLDVSNAGHQPMVSACGRYVLVLNGEIYNHLALRELLTVQGQAPDWRGHSDTETLLAAMVAWGIEATLKSAVGMFALALWDRNERALYLARDRMGEKPLYYGFTGPTLFFASELKALHPIPGVDWAINRDAVALMMRHNYIPAPHSIHRNVRKLMPGSYLRYTRDTLPNQFDQQTVSYWSAYDVALDGVKQPLAFSRDDDALDALDGVLATSIRGQMMADVPLGAFLSGGIDSSLVVAMMQSQCADPVNTFSIGFNEPRFNEAEHARAVAEHLGARHTELYVSAHDAMSVLPGLPEIYDEPFADASQIPTCLLMRLARQHVTVSLSGDGGDELFGGYSRYQRAMSWWARRASLPSSLSQAVGRVSGGAARWMPGASRSQRLAKLGHILTASGAGPFYQQFVSYQGDPASFVLGANLPPTPFDKATNLAFFDHITWLDAVTYLPDDILVKVDRAAMAVSLETRVPMLDHRVYAFARRLPQQYKIRDGQGKWLLRQLLHRYVPPALVDRPKKGFSVPLGEWLRDPLREWAASLLDPVQLKHDGLFDADRVQQEWRRHLSGREDRSGQLWGILMTQAWLAHYRDKGLSGL